MQIASLFGILVRKTRDENWGQKDYNIVIGCEKRMRKEALTSMNDTKTKARIFESADELASSIEAYFGEYLEKSGEVADVESLADYLGTTRDELNALMTDKEFGNVLKLARNRIAKIKKQLAFSGKIPAAVLSFDLKNNHGYKDKPEEADTTPHESVIFKGKTSKWAQ